MKTFRMRQEDVVREWHHIDATNQILGKLAVRVATLLMGKHRPTFTPGVDTGLQPAMPASISVSLQ